MIRLLNKIKVLLQAKQQTEIVAKIASLEKRITSLEKANLIILTKLLQADNAAKQNTKRDNKSEILIAHHKDLNAGKTPTYH